MAQSWFYVLLDIDQIQRYIFATTPLKEIRGASAILNKIGEEKEVRMRLRKHCGKLIYTGGGMTKALFKNKKKAQEFIIDEKEYITQATRGATLTAIIVETNRHEYINDFQNLNTRAERKLHQQKDWKVRIEHVFAHPYLRLCDSCRTYPATERTTIRRRTMLLCKSCFLKNEESENTRYQLFYEFAAWLKKTMGLSGIYTPPKDLNMIAESTKNNYIGLVVCDANRMGEKLREIGDNPKKFKNFSKRIKEYTKLALFKAIYKSFRELLQKSRATIPVEFIILGGDDIVCVVPANKAIEVAQKICKGFHILTLSEKNEKEKLEVSMSAGVAISHQNFPLARLHSFAEELLKSAKHLSYSFAKRPTPIEVSCLDFFVISSPSTNSLQRIRSDEFTCQNDDRYLLYRRPYRVYDSIEKCDDLATLVTTIRKFKSSGFARTKLNQLYEVLQSKNPSFITFDSLMVYSRLNNEYREVFKETFLEPFGLVAGKYPWQEFPDEDLYKTPISDLVELYEFID